SVLDPKVIWPTLKLRQRHHVPGGATTGDRHEQGRAELDVAVPGEREEGGEDQEAGAGQDEQPAEVGGDPAQQVTRRRGEALGRQGPARAGTARRSTAATPNTVRSSAFLGAGGEAWPSERAGVDPSRSTAPARTERRGVLARGPHVGHP